MLSQSLGGSKKTSCRLQWLQWYKFTFAFIIESELLCLLLRWPYSQSMIGSQYNKTTYISQSTTNILTWIKWEIGGWWWVQVSFSKFLNSSLVFGVGFQVFFVLCSAVMSDVLSWASIIWFLVPYVWHQVASVWCRMSSFWCRYSCALHLSSGVCHLYSSMLCLVFYFGWL